MIGIDRIPLTDEQIELLQPLIDRWQKSIENDLKPGAVIAQIVFSDPECCSYIRAAWADHETSLKIQELLVPHLVGKTFRDVAAERLAEWLANNGNDNDES